MGEPPVIRMRFFGENPMGYTMLHHPKKVCRLGPGHARAFGVEASSVLLLRMLQKDPVGLRDPAMEVAQRKKIGLAGNRTWLGKKSLNQMKVYSWECHL